MSDVQCPKCGSGCWDNRLTKKNPKQPDHKCKNKECDFVVWPPRNGQPAREGTSVAPARTVEKSAYSAGPHIPAMDGPKESDAVVKGLDNIFNTYSACYSHAAHLCKQEFQQDASDAAVASMAAALLIAAQKAGLC